MFFQGTTIAVGFAFAVDPLGATNDCYALSSNTLLSGHTCQVKVDFTPTERGHFRDTLETDWSSISFVGSTTDMTLTALGGSGSL